MYCAMVLYRSSPFIARQSFSTRSNHLDLASAPSIHLFGEGLCKQSHSRGSGGGSLHDGSVQLVSRECQSWMLSQACVFPTGEATHKERISKATRARKGFDMVEFGRI